MSVEEPPLGSRRTSWARRFSPCRGRGGEVAPPPPPPPQPPAVTAETTLRTAIAEVWNIRLNWRTAIPHWPTGIQAGRGATAALLAVTELQRSTQQVWGALHTSSSLPNIDIVYGGGGRTECRAAIHSRKRGRSTSLLEPARSPLRLRWRPLRVLQTLRLRCLRRSRAARISGTALGRDSVLRAPIHGGLEAALPYRPDTTDWDLGVDGRTHP